MQHDRRSKQSAAHQLAVAAVPASSMDSKTIHHWLQKDLHHYSVHLALPRNRPYAYPKQNVKGVAITTNPLASSNSGSSSEAGARTSSSSHGRRRAGDW